MIPSHASSYRKISFRVCLTFAALGASVFPACSADDACPADACGEAGAPSTGGAKPSTGGARSGGADSGVGGRGSSGGAGGSAGEAAQLSGGSAGEGPGAGGGKAEDELRVAKVEIDGREVDSGDAVTGVHEGARIDVTFNRRMDTLSVERAFVARSDESSLSSFVVGWNEENTVLTLLLRDRVKYEEVSSLGEPAPVLGFLLTRSAQAEDGAALSEEFFVTFSLLRRLTLFIEPDLGNSAHAYGNVPYGYQQEVDGQVVPTEYVTPIGPWGDNCPWLDPENDHDPFADTFRGEFPYTAARNFSSVPGRHGGNPRGTRVAIYSFPLADLPTSGLERATLKLAKWTRVRRDTSDRDGDGSTTDYIRYYSNVGALFDLAFSVDALPSFALPTSRTSSAAQAVFGTSASRANLLNSLGEEYSKDVGFFTFDVKDMIEDGIDSGDEWGMFRADFDGLPVIKDDPITVCVTMGLEAAALLE